MHLANPQLPFGGVGASVWELPWKKSFDTLHIIEVYSSKPTYLT
jgi:hypothetical protein